MSPTNPPGNKSADRLSELHAQVAALRRRRLSSSTFREWKPDVFYYLFALAAAVVLALALGISTNRPWGIALSGFGFGLLFCAPPVVNRFRYWVRIRRPNRGLDRRIDSLLAEIDRLKEG